VTILVYLLLFWTSLLAHGLGCGADSGIVKSWLLCVIYYLSLTISLIIHRSKFGEIIDNTII